MPALNGARGWGYFGLLWLALSQQCGAQTRLQIEGSTSKLDGYWYAAAPSAKPAPAIVALHGCAGMLTKGGDHPNRRTEDYARLINARGWHVLFVDSLSARGYTNVCGRSGATVSPADRIADVRAAIDYLVRQSEVDPRRLGVLGWSHGGSVTLLAASTQVSYAAKPKGFVAFYPGCGTQTIAPDWRPAHPVLMQLGELDDWTEVGPCQQLASRWPSSVKQDTYAGAGHGFDAGTPVQAMQIPTGSGRTRTVHVGGQTAAGASARERMFAFFDQQFAENP